MADKNTGPRPKGAWAIAAAAGGTVALAAAGYLRLVTAWAPGALQPLPDPDGRAPAFFRLNAPASSVELAGSFNGWRGQPMTRAGREAWEARLRLAPGRHHYLFNVDGRWTPDPANPKTERMGTLAVSVKVVR